MDSESQESLIIHISELRKLLIQCLLAIAIMFPISFLTAPYIIDRIVEWSFPPELGKLNYFSPMEVLITQFKLGFLIGFIISFPYVVWKIWQYLFPALYENERKILKNSVLVSTILFCMGAAFCIFLVLPAIMKFSAGFATENLQPMLSLSNFLGFSGMLIFSFGLMFQVPLIVFALVRMGIISVEGIKNKRPYVVVIILILSGILTPTPDIFNQLLLAAPTYLLFEIGLFFSRKYKNKKQEKAEIL